VPLEKEKKEEEEEKKKQSLLFAGTESVRDV
jgi:hypothetical protein